ncbi:hypothetical protein QTP86_024118, partial [Hemibagrus guttatus]
MLIMRHIKTQLPPSLDPLQFVYRPNRSTDDAIITTNHLALTHLDNKDSCVGMLFIDFSSEFNTIIPQHLIEHLSLLDTNTSLFNWILDFLTGRPQSVQIGNSISRTTTLSTGAPQICVLSPLLFILLTHDCAAMHSSNYIIKFTDDTTVVGLISKNNLSLNVDKTKEMVVDFRRAQNGHSPLFIDGSSVEIVKSTKYLGVHLAENSIWSLNTSSITKKASLPSITDIYTTCCSHIANRVLEIAEQQRMVCFLPGRSVISGNMEGIDIFSMQTLNSCTTTHGQDLAISLDNSLISPLATAHNLGVNMDINSPFLHMLL